MLHNLTQSARHTDGAARHGDGSRTFDIRHLVTAIDIGQNMATTNQHF